MLTLTTDLQPQQILSSEPSFYYFAYGSCMCPLDLERSLGEKTCPYLVGTATLKGYRLGFHYYSAKRQCGALDIVPDPSRSVEGVLYCLPSRLSGHLDQREEVHLNGYRHELVTVQQQERPIDSVRTYRVVQRTPQEVAPNDWYADVVLRGATTCQLPEPYQQKLLDHIRRLRLA